MLYYLSNENFTSEIKLTSDFQITNAEEKVRKQLVSTSIPDPGTVEITAFTISDFINKTVKEQNEKAEVYKKELKEYTDKCISLNDEERIAKEKEGTLVKPEKVRNYQGVLIGEDVPNYLINGLITNFRKNNINIYFVYSYKKKMISNFEKINEFGLMEPKETFTGEKIYTIFKMF